MSNNKLNDLILTHVQASNLNDYDQLSALGIAYSWTRENKPFVPSPQPGYQKRDALATLLIETLQEFPTDEHRPALAHARRVINAPFERAGFAGTAKAKEPKRGRIESSNGNSAG